jgi:hypothetical protein
MTKRVTYIQTSEDGRYGLTGPDEHGYHYLYRIVTDPRPDDWDDEIHGSWGDFSVGAVANPENFYTAIDAAEEETRSLIAAAREEFGR